MTAVGALKVVVWWAGMSALVGGLIAVGILTVGAVELAIAWALFRWAERKLSQ